MSRLYNTNPAHRQVLEWLDSLPKDTRGRPRVADALTSLVLREIGSPGLPAAPVSGPVSPGNVAGHGLTLDDAPTPEPPRMPSRDAEGEDDETARALRKRSLYASLRRQLESEN